MEQLTFVENNYHGLSIDCKLRKIHFLTESANRNAFNQLTISTIFFSVQIQFTISHISLPQSIVPINQPVDQGIKHATEHATGHAIENFIEYAIIQPNEHQSERRPLIQSVRRPPIFSENEEFEKIFESQFLKYQPNFRNDVRYQFNFRNDVRSRNEIKYQSDSRNDRYQSNLRNEVRSNRDHNETENDRYNSKFQNVRKQKFYYENIYQQQPSSHSAVKSVHQSMHSFSFRISVRFHTFQIQLIRRSISERPHTIINQSFFTFQNPSFHRATDQSGILPQINQSRYVSIFAASFAPIYVSATGNASVYAPTNAPVYTPVYALTYASAYATTTGYGSATGYASKLAPASASASTRTSRFETTVLD